MAGDWIKMRRELGQDPDVIQIACITLLDEFGVVGRLHAVWSWLDAHSETGEGVRINSGYLDRLTACPGFASAMRAVGWLAGEDGSLDFPGYQNHNGATAKNRAAETKRKQEQRDKCPGKVGTNVPESPGPEKRREEKRIVAATAATTAAAAAAADGFPASDQILIERINSLRPSWSSVAVWSGEERLALAVNRECFSALSEAVWSNLADYLSARLPQGSPGWQPRKRLKFLESIIDVVTHAEDWSRKRQVTPKPQPVAVVERQHIPRQELEEIFGKKATA
jgi:hypothetical protein